MTKKHLEKLLNIAMSSANLSVKQSQNVVVHSQLDHTKGYNAGYADAISDVMLAMNGGFNGSSRFWPKPDAARTYTFTKLGLKK